MLSNKSTTISSFAAISGKLCSRSEPHSAESDLIKSVIYYNTTLQLIFNWTVAKPAAGGCFSLHAHANAHTQPHPLTPSPPCPAPVLTIPPVIMWLQGSWRSIWGQVARLSHVSMEADPGETAASLPVKPHRSVGTHWNVSLHGYNLTARKSAKVKMRRFALLPHICDVSNLKDELSDIRHSTKNSLMFPKIAHIFG